MNRLMMSNGGGDKPPGWKEPEPKPGPEPGQQEPEKKPEDK